MEWFWSLLVPEIGAADDPTVSPLRTRDLAGVAPYDPLRDEGEACAVRLRDAGVQVESRRFDGMVHGFLRMPGVIARAADAVDLVAARVRAALTVARAS